MSSSRHYSGKDRSSIWVRIKRPRPETTLIAVIYFYVGLIMTKIILLLRQGLSLKFQIVLMRSIVIQISFFYNGT
jgi:hypothetical protein